MANQIQALEYEGYLVADPEMRYTPSGKPVTNFRIGSNRQYKTADGEVVKETTWLKIATWGKLAEICNSYLAKGSHVIVKGILRVGANGSPEVYQLRDGNWAASYEVTANEVRILSGKTRTEDEVPVSEDDNEIPF